jgi:magnesium-transporting ATPase (P-type)
MSCIVRDGSGRVFVVVKGSPEAIGERVLDKHSDYDATSTTLSKKGLRVIAEANLRARGTYASVS